MILLLTTNKTNIGPFFAPQFIFVVPSPPSGPPIIYHSERAQRLHMKLRKKSEQNRLNKITTQPAAELMTATSYAAGSYSAAESNETPPSSPKKGAHRREQ